MEGYPYISLSYSRPVKAELFLISNDIIYYLIDDETQDFHSTRKMQLWKKGMKETDAILLVSDVASEIAPVLFDDCIYYVSFDDRSIKQINAVSGELIYQYAIDNLGYYIGLDGKSVCYASTANNQTYVYNFEERNSTAIGSDIIGYQKLYGDSIFYLSEKDGTFKLNRISLLDNNSENLGVEMSSEKYSIINDVIYFLNQNKVYSYNINTKEISDITQIEDYEFNTNDYMMDSSYIYFLGINKGLDNNVSLWRVDRNSSKKELLSSWYQE